ncbi:MAG: hypothetical protein ACOVOQ_01915 [Flavobacterium sp.]|jgi:hypothetical protein
MEDDLKNEMKKDELLVTFKMNKSLYLNAKKRAKQENRSFSGFVRELIKENTK